MNCGMIPVYEDDAEATFASDVAACKKGQDRHPNGIPLSKYLPNFPGLTPRRLPRDPGYKL